MAKEKTVKKSKSTELVKTATYGKGLNKPSFIPGFDVDNVLDAIEKKIGVTSSGMNSNEKRMSTGMLMYDLILGGGITDGWYTAFGKEQSCKSTGAMTLLASGIINNIPVLGYFDYEGSTEPVYVQNILTTMGLEVAVEDVFGIKDKKGVYIRKPRVRYVSSSTAETFFDYIASLERALPDKIYEGENWWYVYENSRENRKKLDESKSEYDKTLFSKYNKFYVKAEDGGLQALVMVDSYPAMLPERLAEEDSNAGLGAVARMFAEQIPRVKGAMKKKRIAIVGVNQLRDRPMVRFGCFYYTAKVLLANGKTENIGSIVNAKKPVEVMSYNEKTKAFEPKKVVNWFKNGVAEPGEFLKIVVRAGNASGYSQIPCTPNHLLRDYKTGKMLNAKKFKVGDNLTTYATLKELNSDQKQFLIGSLLGDGTIGRTATGAKFSFGHGAKQNSYIRWKNWLLSSYSGSLYGNSKSGLAFDTRPINDPYLLTMHKEHRATKKTQDSREYNSTIGIAFRKLDLRSLAIWYLDDGSLDRNEMRISASGRSVEDKKILATRIAELTGVSLYVTKKGLRCGAKEDTLKFLTALAPYIHKSMKYKLPQSLQELAGSYAWSNLLGKEKTIKVPAEIVSIVEQPMFKGMSRVKYDLEVEGNHNYIVGNCVVHNSPEYEPSGNAVRFYCFDPSSTLLLSDKGILKATDLINKKIDYKISNGSKLETPNIFNFVKRESPTKISTDLGVSITASESHRIWTLTKDSAGRGIHKVDWKTLSNVKPTGSYIAVSVGHDIWSRTDTKLGFTYKENFVDNLAEKGITLPTKMTPALARLLGYLTSEGYVRQNMSDFTNTSKKLCDDYSGLFNLIFNVTPEVTKLGNVYHLKFVSAKIGAFFRYLGIDRPSYEKEIPSCVLTSSRLSVINFLRGYCEGESSPSKRELSISSTSQRLLSQVHQCLLNLNILAKLSPGKRNWNSGKHLYSLYLCGDNYRLYNTIIGHFEDRKKTTAKAIMSASTQYSTQTAKNLAKVWNLGPLTKYAEGIIKTYNWDAKDILNNFESLLAKTETARTSQERERLKTNLKELVAFCRFTVDNSLIWTKVNSVVRRLPLTDLYDFNMPNSKLLTNSIVSHNSDVRIKHMARAVSAVSDATASDGGVELENSVEYEGTKDTYRYISISGDKNKKSTPFLKAFLRLWVNDGDNSARGFDPVFDTYEYLKATDQVSSGGRRSKIMIKIEGKVVSKKPIDWSDFKRLILGSTEEIKQVCKKAGFEKPVRLRKFCFKQMADGTGLELYGNNRKFDKKGSDE